jgi:ketosteroid isomerase-like protein
MSAADDLDQVLEQFHLAQGELLKGNAEPVNKLVSHQDDVTLANPLGPPMRGWDEVAKAAKHAASQVRDGEITSVETVAKHVTAELAYVVQIERAKAKIGGSEELAPIALRTTMIFRPEDGTWKIVHRHADPIVTPRPVESMIQE